MLLAGTDMPSVTMSYLLLATRDDPSLLSSLEAFCEGIGALNVPVVRFKSMYCAISLKYALGLQPYQPDVTYTPMI